MASRPALRVAIVLAAVAGAVLTRSHAPAGLASSPGISARQRDATFTFGPHSTQTDRALILNAVAGAGPGARALIERIDGITTIDVGATPSGAAGITTGGGDHYDIVLDLDSVQQQLGPRGVSRLVLHELGHVVDHALVSEELRQQLDAGIALYIGYAVPPPPDLEAWAAPLARTLAE